MKPKIFKFNFISLFAVVIFVSQVISSQTEGSKSLHFNKVNVYVTAKSSNDLLKYDGERALEVLEQPDENFPFIMIDLDKSFQTIEGFGGAFTDASAEVYGKLTPEKQKEFIAACFDPVKGNGYTLCRSTIHSCDYASNPYTYAEVEDDIFLEHFTIKHDLKDRIPMIKAAISASDNNLKIFSSPWSPPAWMKTNNNMLYGGKLKTQYQQTWADYFVKYVQEYKKQGIDIWGLTVQNEPMATQVWESCIFTAKEERDFVRDYLGPALQKSGLEDIKLMIWDHNRGIMYQRAEVVYNDPEASKYVWGTAFHWYVGDHYDNVRMVHDAFPDKMLLYSEAGMEGEWDNAENLAKNIIIDLNNWTNAWVYWNLILDENRAPRHAGGIKPGGKSVVTANLQTGEVIYNPPFYYFGHFSKFIRPEAKRIACTSNDDDLIATAFINPDNNIAVVILNDKDYDKNYYLWFDGKAARGTMRAHSIVTIVMEE